MKLAPVHFSTRITLFTLALLLGAALLLGLLYERNQREMAVMSYSALLGADTNAITARLQTSIDVLRRDVLFLSRLPTIDGLIRADRNGGIDTQDSIPQTVWRQRFTETLLAFAQARPDYFQLRLIGIADNGRELVRVERRNGTLFVTRQEELQQKGQRDYFAATLDLPPGEVYLSEVNLNREHGQIEPERRRTLRAATPLYTAQGEPFGLIIINLDMGPIFDQFSHPSLTSVQSYVTNERGDYLAHPDPARTFGFDYGHSYRLPDDFPGLAPLYNQDADMAEAEGSTEMGGERYRFLFQRLHFDPHQPQRFLGITLAFPETVITQQLRAAHSGGFLLIGVLTLCSMAAILFALRRMMRPLHELTDTARQMGRGEYQVHPPANLSGELAVLGDALGTAAQAIRRRETDLQTLNALLEQRIEERTHQLHNEQLRQQLILDTMGDGILAADREGRLLLWNDRAHALLGLTPTDLPLADWVEHYGLYHPDGRPFTQDELPMARALHGVITPDTDILIRNSAHPQGIHVNARGRPILNEAGELIGGILMLYDITERDAMAEQILQARNRLTHLLSASPVILYSVRAGEYAPSFISANVQDILGYAPTEIIGNPDWWMEKIHPDDRPQVLASADSSQWQNQRIRRRYRLRGKDGRYLWVEDRCIVTHSEEGEPGELVGSLLDISHAMSVSERLEKIAYNVPGTVYQYRLRPDGTSCFPYASQGLHGIYGVSPEEVSEDASPVFARIHPEDISRVTRSILESAANLSTWGCEYRVRLPERELWVEGSATPEREVDGSILWHGHIREITARKQSEFSLRLLASVFEHSTEGILITDTKMNILQVNQSFTAITGYSADEAIGRTPRLLSSGWHDSSHYQKMWNSIQETGQWQGEMWDRRKNGEIYVEQLSISAVRDADGNVSNYIGVFYDITEKKQTERYIHQLAYHDSLTGLANRRLFEDRLEVAVRQARRGDKQVALLYIDLDRFKPVNDNFGHKAGDILLTEVAQRLQGEIRESDTVARLGGDEFALILDQIGEMDATHIARKLLTRLHQPFCIEETELFIGASIGISLYPNDGDDCQTLMKHADIAMYRAKAEGRDNFQFFRPEMTAGAAERLLLENALRQAIERNELELHYQPQIRLSDGRLTGCEALIRWHHPEWGAIPPIRFIPIAEESGLINAIGRWVLQEACRQAKAWAGMAPEHFRIAVNLSARQFRPPLIDLIREDLALCGGTPQLLTLELTESMVMDDPETAIEVMQALGQLGFQLAIDDFGTGYSSLAYLKRFPIHKLKVDRTFVKDLTTDANDAAITATAIALAHHMRLSVVAEGVETAEQIAFLRAQGCGEMQGYYCSPPIPAAEFEVLLRRGRCELP